MRNIFRHFFIVLICTSYTCFAKAQGEPNGKFDEWGQVTMDEMNMKECSFEKNADAMLLLDLAQVYFSKNNPSFFSGGNFYVTTAYYQRFKVFTEKGKRRADFKQTVSINSKEKIKNITATCYNWVNGQIQKTSLQPTDIHTTKLNEYQEQVTFSVPGVTVGSVFELGYEREQIVNYTLPRWYFTSDVPSVRSTITVGFLDAISYYIDKHVKSGELEEKGYNFTSNISGTSYSSNDLTGRAITYTTRNEHSYHIEPYTNASRNYTNWIGFQLRGLNSPLNMNANIVNSFSSFVNMVLNNTYFGNNLNSNTTPKKEWKALIKEGMSDKEKAKVIFEYVRSNLKWNGYGGYIPKETNEKVWKDKTGSQAEINLFLISTLRKAGLTVYPMLISNRSKGYVNTQHPIMDDFVGVDACVSLGGDTDLVLDATHKFLPYDVPPLEQLNTKGLVIKDFNTYYWHLISDNTGNRESAYISGEMDENGRITGDISMSDNTYSAYVLANLKTNNKQTALNEWIKARIPNATIESSSDSFDAVNCKFLHNIKFSAQATTDNEGNVYLSIPSVYGSTNNLFVNAERTADVDMAYKTRADVVMQIKVPVSFETDSVTPSVSLLMPDQSITFMYNSEFLSGSIVLRQKLDYAKPFFPLNEYPAFYEFFQKYYTMKQKPIILKKKK